MTRGTASKGSRGQPSGVLGEDRKCLWSAGRVGGVSDCRPWDLAQDHRAGIQHGALGTSSVCPSREPRLHGETSSSAQGGSPAWAKSAHSLRSLTQCYPAASQGPPCWGGGADAGRCDQGDTRYRL